MSNILVTKEMRNRFTAALEAANIIIDVGGTQTPVTFLKQPPAGWVVEEKKLPAIYVFSTAENIQPETLESKRRELSVDVVLMAKSVGDPQDQLDDMQLAVEVALLAPSPLHDVAVDVSLNSVSIAHDQGRAIFGVRSMSYGITCHVTAADPSF